MVLRTVLLHLLQEFDDDLGGGSDEDLSSATLLGVADRFEAVGQYGHANHLGIE